MKRKFFVLSFIFLSSCGLFTENHRDVKYDLGNGEEITLTLYDRQYPFSDERTLFVYGSEYSLKGRDCDAAELKNFSRKLWTAIAERNDLSKITSGKVNLYRRQSSNATPGYCGFTFSRNENGEWVND